jgi:hypothetical protein
MPESGPLGVDHDKVIFEQVLRATADWNDSVRGQQTRAATLLATTGFMIGLLTPLAIQRSANAEAQDQLILAVIALAGALCVGLVAMFPYWRTRFTGLNDPAYWRNRYRELTDSPHIYQRLNADLLAWADDRLSIRLVNWLRTVMIIQLALLAAAAALVSYVVFTHR